MEVLAETGMDKTVKKIDEKLSDVSADSGYETATVEIPAGVSSASTSSLSESRIGQHTSPSKEPDHEDGGQKKEENVNGLVQRLFQMEHELKALKSKQ